MSENKNNLIVRPPVICIVGHVDHGKSTLLDYIRKTNIVDGEAGGITQKVSAYEVEHNGHKITFLDTPGHEAFGGIRARGVEIADIAILVVSAEDGVKKQTLEALHCIKASGLPYIVAINKIDRPGADVEKIKINLAENEVYLEGFGGSVPFVPISAKTGQGVSDLLDMMLLVAEMEELRGDPALPADGTVIETMMDSKKGMSATLVIKNGSINPSEFVVCGDAHVPTRMMENFLGKKITEAQFSSPIKVIGWNKMPKAGYPFTTVTTKSEAEELANSFKEDITKINFCSPCGEGEAECTAFVDLIIKTDNIGTLEGVGHELAKIKNERVKVRVIYSGVGDITETDIKTANSKPGTLVLGFEVKVDPQARGMAERNGIDIKLFNIIYKLSEYVEEIMTSRTPKIMAEENSGQAKILKVFSSVKDKYVIGGRVEKEKIEVGDDVKLMRGEEEIGKGKINGLQQQKEKTKEVREGVEFGCLLQMSVEPAPGDKIVSYKMIEK
jgi:translation initiation factor IF-2